MVPWVVITHHPKRDIDRLGGFCEVYEHNQLTYTRTGQRAVMLCGWEGNRSSGGK